MSALQNLPGGRSRKDGYYLDPGEVNVHQFYPVLDLTFGKQQAIIDKKSFLAPSERSGLEPEHTRQNDKVARSPNPAPEIVEEKETNASHEVFDEERTSSEQGQSSLLDGSSAEQLRAGREANVILEAGVFPTSVNEESIKAAKERSQKMFLVQDWRSGGPQIKRGTARIVAQRANEYFETAMRMKSEGNLVGAATCLTKAINFCSNDPVFFVERGEAYLGLGDFQSAILNYKKACLLVPSSTSYQARLVFILHFQGQVLFDLRLFAEALESFSRACEMVPDNFCYQMRCISCLAALQRHGECMDMINKSLDEHKTNPDLYIMRARLNEFFANTSSCYQDVKEALNLDPNHSEGQAMMEVIIRRANSHKHLALQLCIKGKDHEALQKITLAIQTNPGEANFHVLRGALHRKLKDFNAAVDDFLLALDKCGHKEEDPVFNHAQRQLLLTFNDFAVDCFHKSCYMEAITLLNKALNEEKTEKSLYVNRGDCFFKQDELTFALQDYEQALDIDPHDPSIKFRISLVYNELGVRLFQDKNYLAAERKFSLAIELCPLVGNYYISRCRTRYLSENLSAAREDLLRALLLSPTSEGITSICSRLFPGRSLADIINSPAGRDTQTKLANLFQDDVSAHSAGDLDYPNNDGDAGPEKLSGENPAVYPAAEQWENSVTSTAFVICMKDMEFYVRQAQEKRKVGLRVKDALLNNRSLRYDGPQVLSLPLISRKHNRTPQGHKPVLSTSSGKDKSSVQRTSNWRNCSLSITRS